MSQCKDIAFWTCAGIGSAALIAGGIPLLSTSVLGIGACAELQTWTVLIALSPILIPLYGMITCAAGIGCNKDTGQGMIVLAIIAAYGIAACLVAGTYMIPTELLPQTISGQLLISSGIAPEALTFLDVYGVDVAIGAAACAIAGICALTAFWLRGDIGDGNNCLVC